MLQVKILNFREDMQPAPGESTVGGEGPQSRYIGPFPLCAAPTHSEQLRFGAKMAFRRCIHSSSRSIL